MELEFYKKRLNSHWNNPPICWNQKKRTQKQNIAVRKAATFPLFKLYVSTLMYPLGTKTDDILLYNTRQLCYNPGNLARNIEVPDLASQLTMAKNNNAFPSKQHSSLNPTEKYFDKMWKAEGCACHDQSMKSLSGLEEILNSCSSEIHISMSHITSHCWHEIHEPDHKWSSITKR